MLQTKTIPFIGKKKKSPPSRGVRVVSVRIVDGTGTRWTFNAPVTVAPGEPACAQLRVLTESGWHSSAVTWQDSPTVIACDLDCEDLDLAGGQQWEIVETPVNLDFGDKPLSLPQTGTTLPVEGE